MMIEKGEEDVSGSDGDALVPKELQRVLKTQNKNNTESNLKPQDVEDN